MNNRPINPYRYLARVTIQFDTPFIIGSGQDDLFFDSVFASDANGLPTLPGSSLAGILRHALREAAPGQEEDLFGFQEKDRGCGSRLSVSFGLIHNCQNIPVEGIINDRSQLRQDTVLAEALMTTVRDHVRITHKGTAANQGKFDERSVSAGHRFTFELMLEGDQKDAALWQQLLCLLQSDSIRIGGKTRRGYGSFSVISLKTAVFNLTTPEGFKAFCAHPVSLAAPSALVESLEQQPPSTSSIVTATVTLEPEGFWMIGGGYDDQVDLAPLTANRIVWEGNQGRVDENRAILTGSAIKGALSHRSAFHYNRLRGAFAGEVTPAEHTGTANRAVAALFGSEKKEKGGQRGRVIISDLFIEKPGPQKIINHVSIDRFTGGARTLAGALFDEKPYYGGEPFALTITITEADKIDDPDIRAAFAAALDDLARGRLALGAGAGRGNGFFRGAVRWNDAGSAWLTGGKQA